MLTDSQRRKDTEKEVAPRSKHAITNRQWSDSQKIEAATCVLAVGSLQKASHLLQIPETTLKMWQRTEWWQDLIKQLKQQENLVVSTKLKNLIDKSLTLLADRLEHGDFIYDQKQGQLVRKPIPAKELAKLATDFLERREVLDMPERATIAEENISNKLEQLAKQFEVFAQKQLDKPPVVVTDIVFEKEPDNAVHEEREEGL